MIRCRVHALLRLHSRPGESTSPVLDGVVQNAALGAIVQCQRKGGEQASKAQGSQESQDVTGRGVALGRPRPQSDAD